MAAAAPAPAPAPKIPGVRLGPTMWESKAAVGNSWKNLATRAKIERQKLYEDALDQYSLSARIGLKAPQTKNLQECPSSMVNGKLQQWKAYEYPDEKKDDVLKEQWSIRRKDYMGKTRELFCYPDEFDGQAPFAVEADNPPVDLSLYTYVSPAEVSKSLQDLTELLMPDRETHEAEKRRIAMTNIIVAFQNDTELIQFRKDTVDSIAKIYAANSVLTGSRKLKNAKSIVKKWVETVATVAMANRGLQTPSCVSGSTLKKKMVNNIQIDYCVPNSVFTQIDDDPNLLSPHAKKAVKRALNQFAVDYVQKAEKHLDVDFDDAYVRIRQQQTNPPKI